MKTQKIKDLKKIKNNDNLSYLITILDNGVNKTYLIKYINNNCYQIRCITNLIAFVEKYNIIFENNITDEDLNIIYNLYSLINSKDISDNNQIKQDNIDNQYYDEEIQIYKK